MTVNELLDALDGWGIIYTDEDLVKERLKDWGWKLNTKIEKVEKKEKKND
jgi:hypothetical protein